MPGFGDKHIPKVLYSYCSMQPSPLEDLFDRTASQGRSLVVASVQLTHVIPTIITSYEQRDPASLPETFGVLRPKHGQCESPYTLAYFLARS
jgi:hypothetical protein